MSAVYHCDARLSALPDSLLLCREPFSKSKSKLPSLQRTSFACTLRRGRNGGYPPSPAQIPACSFPALGSSEIRRFRSRNTSRVCHCHQGGWHCFSDPSPDNVSFDGYVSCQPLPHVSGFPALGVLWVDPTSYRPSVILLLVGQTYQLMD